MILITSDGLHLQAQRLPHAIIRAIAYDAAGERLLVQFASATAQFECVDVHLWERIQRSTDKVKLIQRAILAHPSSYPRVELVHVKCPASPESLLCRRGCGKPRHRGNCEGMGLPPGAASSGGVKTKRLREQGVLSH